MSSLLYFSHTNKRKIQMIHLKVRNSPCSLTSHKLRLGDALSEFKHLPVHKKKTYYVTPNPSPHCTVKESCPNLFLADVIENHYYQRNNKCHNNLHLPLSLSFNYTLIQNGRHFSILLSTCKSVLVAPLKGKHSFEFRV